MLWLRKKLLAHVHVLWDHVVKERLGTILEINNQVIPGLLSQMLWFILSASFNETN